MKPRMEKKLSKALVAIYGGTKVLASAWVDNEYCRETLYAWKDKPPLTPKQVRYNRECRVSVSHMPSIGGEVDHMGEGSDWQSVQSAYIETVRDGIWYSDELFRLTHRYPDEPPLTPEEQERLAVLQARAKRQSRRLRIPRNLLAHAREEAAVARFEEAIRADQLAASRARWAAEAAERKTAQQPQSECQL